MVRTLRIDGGGKMAGGALAMTVSKSKKKFTTSKLPKLCDHVPKVITSWAQRHRHSQIKK